MFSTVWLRLSLARRIEMNWTYSRVNLKRNMMTNNQPDFNEPKTERFSLIILANSSVDFRVGNVLRPIKHRLDVHVTDLGFKISQSSTLRLPGFRSGVVRTKTVFA